MAIQNLSFADLLASAQRASSSPVLNMGPPSPTGPVSSTPILGPQSITINRPPPAAPTTQTLRITPSPSQTLTFSPSFTSPVQTISLPERPVKEMSFEDLVGATVEVPPGVSNVAPPAPTAPASYDDRVSNLTTQLKSMYGTILEYEPKARYGGRQSDLDKIFANQAKKLADKGIGDLAQLTEKKDDNGKRFVVNRETNETLFRITKDRDTGADKWGDVFSGVKDGANFGIQFDSEGRAVLFPVHEKTNPLVNSYLDVI